jgi:phenylacetyl-CoA:acceptor oxidoreductase 26-kDa subunit
VIPVDRTQSWHQTNWDWRAAMNFMFGGAGSGLLVAGFDAPLGRYSAAAGALAIAVGLFFVWLEIGRPFRALNVFVHAKTSWMTRESWVSLAALAALAGGVFLYCQGRILTAAKGIPAWRLPIVSPLIMMTGFLEGMAVLVIMGAPLAAGLLLCVVVRALLWRNYRRLLLNGAVPTKARATLQRYFPWIEITGTVIPAVLLLLNVATGFPVIALIAALFAFAGGWVFKLILVTRLGYNQGFSVPKFPNIGSVLSTSSRPGWSSER